MLQTTMKRWCQVVLVVWSMTSCTCWGLSNHETKTKNFDQSFSKDNLQSWDDWLGKRSHGGYPWRLDELTGDKFQNWQDWMYKRRFGGLGADTDFSSFDKSKFQEWKDWVSKRGVGSGSLFPDFSNIDKNKFQQWNEWVSKRMFGMKPGSYQPSFGTATDFQNWADYAKRQHFISPSSDLGISGSPYFQNWHDWVKRMNTNQNTDDTLNNGITKRQLGSNNNRYDSFRRYFTDGLQDWRSTYKGTKRDKNQQKTRLQGETE
uniref:Uncharacterized protein n=1 Tax=Arion vulgaris TaxID=1028688 RepID=A0A0B7A8G8_9EUPU